MSLGTEQGIIDLCGSSDVGLINRQLIKARAIVTSLLDKNNITVPASDVVLDTAVELIASSLVATKPGAVNPRSNFDADTFSRKDGNLSQIDEFKQQGIDLVDDYISTNATVTLPSSVIVGRKGARIGEYEEMSSSEEINY